MPTKKKSSPKKTTSPKNILSSHLVGDYNINEDDELRAISEGFAREKILDKFDEREKALMAPYHTDEIINVSKFDERVRRHFNKLKQEEDMRRRIYWANRTNAGGKRKSRKNKQKSRRRR